MSDDFKEWKDEEEDALEPLPSDIMKIEEETSEIVNRILSENKPPTMKTVTQKSINQIQNLCKLYTLNFDDQETIDRYIEFYKSTAARLDPLVNECSIIRMILAEEASKPPMSKRDKIFRESGQGVTLKEEIESVKENLLADTLINILNIVSRDSELTEETSERLYKLISDALAPKIVRYGDKRIEDYLSTDNTSKYRNDALIIKLANTINQMEKTRQTIADSLGKAQIQVRFNLLVHQLLNILEKKCKDRLLLRDVALAIQELAKQEELEIDWSFN